MRMHNDALQFDGSRRPCVCTMQDQYAVWPLLCVMAAAGIAATDASASTCSTMSVAVAPSGSGRATTGFRRARRRRSEATTLERGEVIFGHIYNGLRLALVRDRDDRLPVGDDLPHLKAHRCDDAALGCAQDGVFQPVAGELELPNFRLGGGFRYQETYTPHVVFCGQGARPGCA
jgi:hypothetical protein